MIKEPLNKSLGHIRAEVFDYIDSHPYYPDFVKQETKQVVSMHFNCIGKILGLVELTFRRTYEYKEEIDPQYKKQE